MNKRVRSASSWLFFVCVLAFAVLYHSPLEKISGSKTTSKMEKSPSPGFVAEHASQLVKELIPFVEGAAGRKFGECPKVRIIDSIQMEKIYAGDLAHQLKNFISNRTEPNIAKNSKEQAKWFAGGVLGKYSAKDKVLYLVDNTISALFKNESEDKEYCESLLKLLIAHELTHALQDQTINFDEKFNGLGNNEELLAFIAAIEGHAVFIHEKIGKIFQLDNAIQGFSKILLFKGPVNDEDPVLKITYNQQIIMNENVYSLGKSFIEYHSKVGGNESIWQILLEPPTNTYMIMNPEKYAHVKATKLNYTKILDGLDKYFRISKIWVENVDVPIMQIRAVYGPLNLTDENPIFSNIVHMQTLKVRHDKVLIGSISTIRLKTKNQCSEFMIAGEKLAEINIAAMKRSTNYDITEFSNTNFNGFDADAHRKLSLILQSKTGEKIRATSVRICRDDLMVDITDHFGHLTEEKVKSIAKTIFRRYQDAKDSEILF